MQEEKRIILSKRILASKEEEGVFSQWSLCSYLGPLITLQGPVNEGWEVRSTASSVLSWECLEKTLILELQVCVGKTYPRHDVTCCGMSCRYVYEKADMSCVLRRRRHISRRRHVHNNLNVLTLTGFYRLTVRFNRPELNVKTILSKEVNDSC